MVWHAARRVTLHRLRSPCGVKPAMVSRVFDGARIPTLAYGVINDQQICQVPSIWGQGSSVSADDA